MSRTNLILDETRGRAEVVNVILPIDRPVDGLMGELPQTWHQPVSSFSSEFPHDGLGASDGHAKPLPRR
jgi:hypothetical protein